MSTHVGCYLCHDVQRPRTCISWDRELTSFKFSCLFFLCMGSERVCKHVWQFSPLFRKGFLTACKMIHLDQQCIWSTIDLCFSSDTDLWLLNFRTVLTCFFYVKRKCLCLFCLSKDLRWCFLIPSSLLPVVSSGCPDPIPHAISATAIHVASGRELLRNLVTATALQP